MVMGSSDSVTMAGNQGPRKPNSIQVDPESWPVSISPFLRIAVRITCLKTLTYGSNSFVVEDENYNYISARWPGDAELFAEEIIKLFESFNKIV
jgi:hypothetical protein